MEMKMFPFCFYFVFFSSSSSAPPSLLLSFGHHKAFSDLAWHILSLPLMSKMANKNVYDARTHTQVNSWKIVPQEALNTY